jgi:response regulator RpfG family c-di-GMP phosphodiesterase
MDVNLRHSILLVDDDINLLKNLNRIFQNHYDVRIAISGEDALKALRSGFKPAVIVADYLMPRMRGSEFLRQSIQYASSATRILLVGHFDVKEIIGAVAEGNAYMYITKPLLDSDVIQAVKIGVDYHKQTTTNRAYKEKEITLVNEIKKLSTQLKQLGADKSSVFEESLRAISSIISVSEKFYFNEHGRYVSAIARALATQLRLRPDVTQSVIVAAQVHNIVAVKMPDKFKISSPFDFTDENDLIKYLNYYNDSLQILKNISAFKEITPIVSQVNEHYDGTGLPNRYEKSQIFIEAQVIAIANTYHNRVYLLEEKNYDEFIEKGKFTQDAETTERRHKKALAYIENKSSWFNPQVANAFKEVLASQTLPELEPVPMDLTIYYNR